MSTISIRVENQLRNSQHVVSSVAVHGGKVAKLLVGLLPGMEEADITKTLRSISDALQQAAEALEKRESEYVAEQADDDGPRNQRDQAMTAGLAALGSAGHRLQSIPSQDDLLKQFGLASGTPGTPDQLLTVLKNASGLLGKSTKKYTDAFGQEVDLQVLGTFLSDHAAPLGRALEQVKTEKRELQEAMIERDRALEHWSDVYQGVSLLLEGYYRLAGLQELAERIRPTIRKRRGESTSEQPVDDPNLSSPITQPTPPQDPA